MTERVFVLSSQDRECLGSVRAVPGLRVAESAGQLWLRGLPATGELPLAVRALPAHTAYALDAQERLFPAGHSAPTARLPPLSWQPIQVFLPLEMPTAALPAQEAPSYRPRLVVSGRAEPGVGLLTTLAAWQTYAESAPEIRLQRLRFAVAADGRVLLLGTPLPPLPGHELWQQQSLLLPAGFDLEAPFLAPLLAQKLNPAADALVLLGEDGSWERVDLEHLVPATRSAVRRTFEDFRNE